MILLVFDVYVSTYATSSDAIFNANVTQERVSNVAYNIVNGLCSPTRDMNAPVYITIGDGGNIEGLATK